MSMNFVIPNRHGDMLYGNLHVPEGAEQAPLCIIAHGFKGFKDWGMFPWMADTLMGQGIACIRFNFSLNGIGEARMTEFTALERFERNSISREIDDLHDIVDAVLHKRIASVGVDAGRLCVLGHSLGGGVAIVAAAEDERIRAVLSWAGVAKFDRWGPKFKKEWRKRGRMDILNARTGQLMPMGIGMLDDLEANPRRFDIPAAAAGLRRPLLLLHGEQDVSVPIDEARQVYAAADAEHTLLYTISATDHTFGSVHPFAGCTPALDEALLVSANWILDHV